MAAKFQVPSWPTFAPKYNLTQALPNNSNRVQICPEHMTPGEENHAALKKPKKPTQNPKNCCLSRHHCKNVKPDAEHIELNTLKVCTP